MTHKWKFDDIPELYGRTIIVTGSLPVKIKSNKASRDLNNIKELWNIFEDLTKTRCDFGEENNES